MKSYLTQPANQIEIKLLKLARNKQYEKGLNVINTFLEKHKSDRFLVQKAFFLYHYAAYLMYDKKKSGTKQSLIQQNFEDATRICKAIIKKRGISKNNMLNARTYLSQIYAMRGRTKKAKELAIQTFRLYPSSFTAERAADIYLRINDPQKAASWYKKSIKLARRDDRKLMAQIGLAIVLKKGGDSKKALQQAQKVALLSELSKGDQNTTLLKHALYAHFPGLNKKRSKTLQIKKSRRV